MGTEDPTSAIDFDDGNAVNNMGIYRIINKVTGKSYVGSALNIKRRLSRHKTDLRSSSHHSIKLQRSWNKYGEPEFEFTIMEYVNNKENLIMREQYWIDQYNSYHNGYNSNPFARSCLGSKRSDEVRAKQSLIRTGRRLSEETKNKISIGNIGRVVSEETKKKISVSNMGKTLSESHRKKLSIARKGKKLGPYKVKPSEETRKKISLAHIGKITSHETKKKQSESLKRFHRNSSSEYKVEIRKRNVSFGKYVGITYDKYRKMWRASIRINGKRKYIGRFKTDIEAAIAYDLEIKKIFGDSVSINKAGIAQ